MVHTITNGTQSASGGPLNLKSAQLQGAVLRFADLSAADLEGGNLTGAELRHVCFNKANLGAANLTGALLDHANLSAANLKDAKPRGASLHLANLEAADLEGADLTGADLLHARSTRPIFAVRISPLRGSITLILQGPISRAQILADRPCITPRT